MDKQEKFNYEELKRKTYVPVNHYLAKMGHLRHC